MFPENKMKAFTLSYDDGVAQDERFVELINKYKLKCTFNLNSGIQDEDSGWTKAGFEIYRLKSKRLRKLYAGHETAIHTLTHPKLTEVSDEKLAYEIEEDIKNLEEMFEQKMVGMAYPYGDYDDRVVEALHVRGIKYARTVEQTFDFEPQTDLLRLKSTCHHNAEQLLDLGKKFVEMKANTPQIFYVWGHTYEFDTDNRWDYIEEFFKLISNHDDIFYGTNQEVLL